MVNIVSLVDKFERQRNKLATIYSALFGNFG